MYHDAFWCVKAVKSALGRSKISYAPFRWDLKGNAEDIIYGLFREFKPVVPVVRDIVFDCPCNRESYVNRVRSLSKDELEDIKKNGPDPIQVICHNCGSVYSIPVSEL